MKCAYGKYIMKCNCAVVFSLFLFCIINQCVTINEIFSIILLLKFTVFPSYVHTKPFLNSSILLESKWAVQVDGLWAYEMSLGGSSIVDD